jgi:hypothetical protein
MRQGCCVLLLSVGAISPGLAADERPTLGTLYNTKENHSLTYECLLTEGVLNCDFVQVSVRPKSDPATAQKYLESSRAEFRKGFDAQELDRNCKDLKKIEDINAGRTKPDFKPAREPNAFERSEWSKWLSAFQTFCGSRTEANFLAAARIQAEREQRTCRVNAYTFKQSFKSIGSGTWVTDGGAKGPCGIVQLSRFEPEVTALGKSSLTNWRYFARKAIANPKGEWDLGKCSELDQEEYLYDWRSDERGLQCDFITFSMF